MKDEIINVSKTKYERLLDKADFLECLEACGVDNWEGYYNAWKMHKEEGEE